jgi:hypothetical protein
MLDGCLRHPTTLRPSRTAGELPVPGQVVRTPFGLVQVGVTIGTDGIADVQARQLPYDRSHLARTSKIVEPMLRGEALQVRSANIDLISGATYTSKGVRDPARRYRPGGETQPEQLTRSGRGGSPSYVRVVWI